MCFLEIKKGTFPQARSASHIEGSNITNLYWQKQQEAVSAYKVAEVYLGFRRVRR